MFENPGQDFEPLASRLRPRSLEEFIGQEQIVGPGRLLRRAIQADQLGSVIFAGPPGTGKTTLARVIANSTRSYFSSLNAVLAGVKEIREAIKEAQDRKRLYGRRTILFVDEVHRWNKSQQDALLPWVENGTIVLIGATTENPFFEVNKALVSRSRIFQLKALSDEALHQVLDFALSEPQRGYGKIRVDLSEEARSHLVRTANGDARTILNALELAVTTTEPRADGRILIDLATAEESIQERAVLYDKEGDYHFDTISAFIKSIRGSDPDAALFWMARMLKAGESPRFIFRRMLISAAEDIGLADPQALVVVEAAASAFERVGLPEGQFFLAQAALYLANTQKSNSNLGVFDALAAQDEIDATEVPNHLKDASRDTEGFGHGQGYLYPHAYRDHWVAQDYLPGPLKGRVFYEPGELGWEGKVADLIRERREIVLSLPVEDSSPEQLSFSPGVLGTEFWLSRTEVMDSDSARTSRKKLFDLLEAQRSSRHLVIGDDAAYFLWEALRRSPEGMTCAIIPSQALRESLQAQLDWRDQLLLPMIFPGIEGEEGLEAKLDADIRFDFFSTRNLSSSGLGALQKWAAEAALLGDLSLDPAASTPLSELFPGLPGEVRDILKRVEAGITHPALPVPEPWIQTRVEEMTVKRTRRLAREDLERWFPAEPGAGGKKNSYADAFFQHLDADERNWLREELSRLALGQVLNWGLAYQLRCFSLT